MVNDKKVKGSRWERDAVKLLNEYFPGTWVRIPTSGAIGTVMNIPLLKGDMKGKYSFLPRPFIGEAKVGYGGIQMRIQKEWFDKIKDEADESYGLPVVVLKFEKARTGVRHVIAMSFETWDEIMREIERLQEELTEQYERNEELQRHIPEQARGNEE